MINSEFPRWLNDWNHEWCRRLGLDGWNITFKMDLAPSGDPGCQANCQQWPLVNQAIITFRADVENDREWRITAIHELLHVKHSRIDSLLENVVFPETGSMTDTSMKRGYVQVYEPFVHGVATSLYETWERERDELAIAYEQKREAEAQLSAAKENKSMPQGKPNPKTSPVSSPAGHPKEPSRSAGKTPKTNKVGGSGGVKDRKRVAAPKS